jgi:hypothetical protein
MHICAIQESRVGVSAVGQTRPKAATIRNVAMSVLGLALFAAWLYLPPLVPNLTNAAARECNDLGGGDFRTYRLEWRTTTLTSLDQPHWLCWNTRTADEPGVDLGWWVAP